MKNSHITRVIGMSLVLIVIFIFFNSLLGSDVKASQTRVNVRTSHLTRGSEVTNSPNGIPLPDAIIQADYQSMANTTYPLRADSSLYNLTTKLTATDAVAGDYFGGSLSLDGNTAVVGNSRYNNGIGAAYIFERDPNGIWRQTKLTLPISEFAALGWSVSISGDTVAIGAPRDDAISFGYGAVYIFERNQGGSNAWGPVALLTPIGAIAGEGEFGRSVSLNGDTIIVGAGGNGDAGFESGTAYVFERNQGGTNAWGQVARLTANDAAAYENFGWSVSINNDTAVVGAYSDNISVGAAYIFERNQGGTNAWGQVIKLTATNAAENDYFGRSVSLDGDTVLIGATPDNDGSGAAYIFERSRGGNNAWGQTAELIASHTAEFLNPVAGPTVSLHGDTAMIGIFNDGFSGSAYIYERNQGGISAWGQVTKLTAAEATENAWFGGAVSINGNMSIIGAPRDNNFGSAYVFKNNTSTTLYLPIVTKPSYPDLVIDSIMVTDAANVGIVVRNIGEAPVTNEFWVDLYVGLLENNLPPTKVNDIWPDFSPYGAAWLVSYAALPLNPGESLLLQVNDTYFDKVFSNIGSSIGANTTLYAQVDSANAENINGGVFEAHEAQDDTYNNVFGPVTR